MSAGREKEASNRKKRAHASDSRLNTWRDVCNNHEIEEDQLRIFQLEGAILL